MTTRTKGNLLFFLDDGEPRFGGRGGFLLDKGRHVTWGQKWFHQWLKLEGSEKRVLLVKQFPLLRETELKLSTAPEPMDVSIKMMEVGKCNWTVIVVRGHGEQKLWSSIPHSRYTSLGSFQAAVAIVSRNFPLPRSRCTVPAFNNCFFPQWIGMNCLVA